MGAGFNWSVGVLMEKFIKSLADKKLLGSKCPGCGYVHAPPRTRCVKCNAKVGSDDIIELSGKGSLLGHTIAHVQLDGKANFEDLDEPVIIGAIKLEDADSTIFMSIEGAEADKLEAGTAVAIQWNDKTEGAISDIKCFKP